MLRWMLKRVPGWGGEWVRWSRLLCNSATGYPGVPAILTRSLVSLASGTAGPRINGVSPACRFMVLWEAAPAPMNATPIAAGARSYKNLADQPHDARHHRRTPTEIRPAHPSWPQTETRFSIPSRSVQARSRQPRSDNHRSRNPVIARKPKMNTPDGQKDFRSKPDHLHLTPNPYDQHLE